MGHETSGTRAEQLSWELKLYGAVGDRVDELLRSRVRLARDWESAYGLESADGTKIRVAVVGTGLVRPQPYSPMRVPELDLGNVAPVRLVPGTHIDKYGSVNSDYRNDVPLDFMIDTRSTRPINAVSTSGAVERSVPIDAHYEAFTEPDGTHIYKLGEDQRLQPVDLTEGGHLLWQIGNSAPAN